MLYIVIDISPTWDDVNSNVKLSLAGFGYIETTELVGSAILTSTGQAVLAKVIDFIALLTLHTFLAATVNLVEVVAVGTAEKSTVTLVVPSPLTITAPFAGVQT